MQNFNFHTHTYLCGHAVGEAEEYVLKAIEAGFKDLGFSEHLCYPDWDDANERIFYGKEDEYIAEINRLKAKYQQDINIYCGFEFEFFEDSIKHLEKMKSKCDYMICGQHAYDRKEHYYDNPEYCSDEYIDMMSKQVERALDLQLCKYVAHPDYFLLSKLDFSDSMKNSIRRIAEAVKRNDAVLEINLKGMKYGTRDYEGINSFYYPNYQVFKIIGEVGCKVVIGYDAHNPLDLLNRKRESEILAKFKDLNLNICDDLTINDLK